MAMTAGRADAAIKIARVALDAATWGGGARTLTELSRAAGFKRSPWTRDAVDFLLRHGILEYAERVQRGGFVAQTYRITAAGAAWLDKAGAGV